MEIPKIAQFEKVKFAQFEKDFKKNFASIYEESVIKSIYTKIVLPKRATKGSAGYDFFLPMDLHLEAGESIRFPTGIRAKIDNGWVLSIFPRSSLGFAYRLQLDNTVGIIDSDYYFSDNEGHILVQLTNDSRKNQILHIEQTQAFMQGIFLAFGITREDACQDVRNGGIGSTNR
ncbi:deoxyuridine 5'-triphosphate nucleotidohydrolase [Clostridia bacterium]|nr:deoxyuridine 5'-triphosphate nucleotidohydrolase [Clostridia bacterium]